MMDLYYVSAYMKTLEKSFLTDSDMSQLIDLDISDIYRKLADLGYEIVTDSDGKILREETLTKHQLTIWHDIFEMMPDSDLFSIYFMPYLCNNIKAILKAKVLKIAPDFMMEEIPGFEQKDLIRQIESKKYDSLPEALSTAIPKAESEFARTGNPQWIDVILDKACYCDMLALARKSESETILNYIQTGIDFVNIKMAVRILLLNQGEAGKLFLKEAMLDGGKLNSSDLISDVYCGLDSFWESLSFSDYHTLISTFRQTDMSLASLETIMDNHLINLLKDSNLSTDSVAPVFSYLFALENEIKRLRILLAGKEANLTGDAIRERERIAYV